MQALYGESAPFGTPLRYRTAGERRWHAGETVELQRSELMFLCDAELELRTEVELILPAKLQVMGRESSLYLLCAGCVIRRFLANWPDLRPALVVDISSCQISSEPGTGDAKPVRSVRYGR